MNDHKYKKYKRKYLNLRKSKNINCHRYIIFAGYIYYPSGGWQDFFDSVDTLEEAKRSYENGIKTKGWAHIVDMKDNKIILNSWPNIAPYAR